MKSHSISRTAGLGAGDSSVRDEHVSDLLKLNFLSSLFACAKLADRVHQASDLGTFLSISLEKQNKAIMHLLQKMIVFTAETIQNSSVVAPFSAHLK